MEEAVLKRALGDVRETLLSNPVSPRVENPADINLHFCRYVAETVAERLGDEEGVEILEDGGRGYVHTWISYDGRHYDAECIDGVRDHRDLPFFQRHPEAAIHLEPGTAAASSLRERGGAPLYPTTLTDKPPSWVASPMDRKLAIGGVLVGLALLALGFGGEWAIQRHFVAGLAGFQPLFVDFEIVGELLVLVSPIIFYVLRPAFRASP